MTQHSKQIGSKIAAARKKTGLSQAELAGKVSISPQAVGKWERGESLPDITTLSRLAEILGLDLNYFSDTFQKAEPAVTQFRRPGQPAEKGPSNPRKRFDWNWDMSQGNWRDADFSGLKNLKEKFSSSNMKNCRFMNADLSGLILRNNNIEKCDFSDANLRDSKIQASNILNNQFGKCAFTDAEFLKCNIENCDFSRADFSGTEITASNLEKNIVEGVDWKFTKFNRTNISQLTFTGTLEDCHFEHCSFYNVKVENANMINCFFKNNEKFKKVQFVNCKVDSITYAFLKNNQANLAGISLI